MNNILVKEISPFALAEEDGIVLFNAISEKLDAGETVQVDFSEINLFATPFFNASLGAVILKYGIEKFDERVAVVGLDDLGMETYNHSRDNALLFLKNKVNLSEVGKNVSNAINEE